MPILDHALSPAPHPLPDPSLHLSLSSLLERLNRRVSFRFPLGAGQRHEHVFQRRLGGVNLGLR